MKVRYLKKTDFYECWRIFYKVFERHEDEAFLNAWISYNPALSYVIIIDDEIGAFLLTRETHIEFIGVKRTHQGKGIGTILLHSLLDRCKRENLSVSLVPSNSDPKLIRWYEKHGFVRTYTYTSIGEEIMIWDSKGSSNQYLNSNPPLPPYTRSILYVSAHIYTV
jgi:ribosomal protein S18 acetylase RimI-like enzyme